MIDIRSMEARVGRKNQRYGKYGERLVAGVVPLSANRSKVLMIQSAGRGGWVLPKGGWESDETSEEAACREAWEEAGVVCIVTRDLGHIPDLRSTSLLTAQAPKASYKFFEAIVQSELPKWPEAHKRGRRWVSYAEAATALEERPELLEALNRSSIIKSALESHTTPPKSETEEDKNEWPEAHRRDQQRVSYPEAATALREPEPLEALNRSPIEGAPESHTVTPKFETEEDKNEWPEAHKRDQQRVSYPEAATSLREPEPLEALNRSPIEGAPESHTATPRSDSEEGKTE